MTEEIEAHVLKKYEILQKLGNPSKTFLNPKTSTFVIFVQMFILIFDRKGSLWHCVEGYWQENEGDRGS